MSAPSATLLTELAAKLPGLLFEPDRPLTLPRHEDPSIVDRMSNGTYRSQLIARRIFYHTFHNCVWELLAACHYHRDLMAGGLRRMSPDLWKAVRDGTSWAQGLDVAIVRSLALQIAQASWCGFQHRRKNDGNVPSACCALSVMALRFVRDIAQYENDTELAPNSYFGEERGPAYRIDERLSRARNGRPATIAVHPITTYSRSTRITG